MIEFGISKGTKLYIASFVQRSWEASGELESGLSIIVLGIRVTFYDNPPRHRKQWVFPHNAWDDEVWDEIRHMNEWDGAFDDEWDA